MRSECRMPGLSVPAKTRMGARKEIRLFAGTLRDRRLTEGKEEMREKSIMQTEPTNP